MHAPRILVAAGLIATVVHVAQASSPIQRLSSMTATRGGAPNASVTFDKNGALYVANAGFGKNGIGSIEKLTPPGQGEAKWKAQAIWSFSGGDGSQPSSPLTPDGQGGFYGTTTYGGTSPFGVVFEIDPTAKPNRWTLTNLWDFSGYQDGGFPVGGVAVDASGTLYGTATIGGGGPQDSHPFGVVYSLTPPARKGGAWTQKTLVRFNNKNGYSPECTPLLDATGALYGTTYGGGKYGQGTVFKLTPPAQGSTKWTHQILYSFADDGDGASPFSAVIEDAAGNLYGTTYGSFKAGSNGTVYRLSPPGAGQAKWTETTLWSFAGGADGQAIFAGVYQDGSGALWGAALGGGTQGHGEIYKLTPPAQGMSAWTKTDVGNFNDHDGANPMGTPVPGPDGQFYGSNFFGGSQELGTIYRIKP